jgi:hypothetical protein
MLSNKKDKTKKNQNKTIYYNNFEISDSKNIKSNNNINLNLKAKLKSENQKKAQKNVNNYDFIKNRKRANSCEELIGTFKNNFNFNIEDEFKMDEEESKFTEFYFDKYDLNKLNDNYEKFPSFSEIYKKKEL